MNLQYYQHHQQQDFKETRRIFVSLQGEIKVVVHRFGSFILCCCCCRRRRSRRRQNSLVNIE